MSQQTKTETRVQRNRRFLKNVVNRVTRNPEATVNALAYGGLAAIGYVKLPDLAKESPRWGDKAASTIVRLLWGPVGLKLATTAGGAEVQVGIPGIAGLGFPVNSQIAGLIMLAGLGFACVPWEGFAKEIQAQIDDTKDAAQHYADVDKLPLTDEERAEKMRLMIAVSMAMMGTPDDLYAANEALRQYCIMLQEKYAAAGGGGAR